MKLHLECDDCGNYSTAKYKQEDNNCNYNNLDYLEETLLVCVWKEFSYNKYTEDSLDYTEDSDWEIYLKS